jgi:alanine racemase
MVKANGYGIGAVEVARALESLDPWGFGVASVAEGAELRRGGVQRPILVLSPLLPEWIDGCLAHELRPSVGDPPALEAWIKRSDRPFHVEIDTGMSRAGLRWDDAAGLSALRATLPHAPGWEGLFTHFLFAETDVDITVRQWDRFQMVLQSLPRPPLVHAANSAAALRGRGFAGDLVRPGIFLYGGSAGYPEPRPVTSLRARVIGIRSIAAGDTVGYGAGWRAEQPAVIATLAIGYADGFPRSGTSGRVREVEVNGRIFPVVGRVTMDMCMAQVDSSVRIGDVATIFGGAISLDQQAAAAGTISYELLTRLGSRLPRRYQRSA